MHVRFRQVPTQSRYRVLLGSWPPLDALKCYQSGDGGKRGNDALNTVTGIQRCSRQGCKRQCRATTAGAAFFTGVRVGRIQPLLVSMLQARGIICQQSHGGKPERY